MNELNLKSRETLRVALGVMEQSAPVAADLETYRPRRRSVRPLRKLALGLALGLAVLLPTLLVPIQVPSVSVAEGAAVRTAMPALSLEYPQSTLGLAEVGVVGERRGLIYLTSFDEDGFKVTTWDPGEDRIHELVQLGLGDRLTGVIEGTDGVGLTIVRFSDAAVRSQAVLVNGSAGWEEYDLPSGDISQIYDGGPAIVAFDYDWERDRTTVWQSDDLKAWSENATFDGAVRDVTWTGSQFVAVGGSSAAFLSLESKRPAIWTSFDGIVWNREDIPSKPWRLRLSDGLEYVVSLPDGSVLAGVGAQAWQLTGTWPPVDPGEAGTLIYRDDGMGWVREYWDDTIIYDAVEYNGGVLGFGKRSGIRPTDAVVDGLRVPAFDVQEGNVVAWTSDLATWQVEDGPAVYVMLPLEGMLAGEVLVGTLCCQSQLATLAEQP